MSLRRALRAIIFSLPIWFRRTRVDQNTGDLWSVTPRVSFGLCWDYGTIFGVGISTYSRKYLWQWFTLRSVT